MQEFPKYSLRFFALGSLFKAFFDLEGRAWFWFQFSKQAFINCLNNPLVENGAETGVKVATRMNLKVKA